jgi:hypothetical protein
MPAAACYCGSGRPVDRCHLMPRRERRHHRKALLALSEAHDTAMLFPWVRPRDDVVEVRASGRDRSRRSGHPSGAHRGRGRADRLRRTPPDRAGAPGPVSRPVGQPRFRRRRRGADRARGGRKRLPGCRAGAVAARPEQARVPGSGAAACVACRHSRRAARPASRVGSARRRCHRSRDPARAGDDEFWSEAHTLADPRVEERHLERVRELAGRIESELPFVGLPRASQLVADGAAQARDEDVAAGWVAGAMLAAYAHLVYTGKIERR